MRLSVILGFFSGFGILLVVIFFKQDSSLYLNWPALLITLGGTLSAVVIYFSPKALANAVSSFIEIFLQKQHKESKIVDIIVDLSRETRKSNFKNILDYESVKSVPFLEKGLILIADGTDPVHIEDILSRDSKTITEKNIVSERVFRIAGSFAPMFGMMGTVIGLIAMLHRVKDPAAIPAAMGLALVTTLYGLILSALVFKPISGKIRDKNQNDSKLREIIIIGILLIKNRENPHIIREKLSGFLQ